MTQISGNHTVREVIDRADEIFFGENTDHSHNHTLEQWAFKQKLFQLSEERKTKEILECDDIDATAFLSEDEFNVLVEEAESLKHEF